MEKNKKMKIYTGLLIILSLSFYQFAYSQADELYYSPYSYYGLGDKISSNALRNRALGSTGIAISSPINIVTDNPASYANLKQTTFEFSSSYKKSRFITDSIRIKRSNIAFDGLTFGFPANKHFTLVLGLNPVSKSGYKVRQISDLVHENDTLKLLTIRSGDGGIQKTILGLGIPFLKHKLNLGVNAFYYFGNISRYKETVFLQQGFINTLVKNKTNYKGWGYHFGVMYSDSMGKFQFRIGASYQTSLKLKIQQTYEYYDVKPNITSFTYIPFDTLEKEKKQFKYPGEIGIGIGLDQFNKLTLGFDFRYFDGTKLSTNEPNTVFKKSFKFQYGLEWVPNFSEEGYWKKVAYRFGGYYHQSELQLFNQSINQTAVTFGMGLPFRRTLSRLNVFFELGQRGVATQNLVKEIYFSTGLGVTFNETWFIKRKLE